MQFNSNSDFPAGDLHTLQWPQIARPPIQFDPADFVPCAAITTRVIIQCDDAMTKQGVATSDAHHVKVGGSNYIVKTAKGVLVRSHGATPSSSKGIDSGDGWSDSSSESDMEDDIIHPSPSHQTHASPHNTERAYWLRRTLRNAIYGTVRYGIVLHRLNPPVQVILPNTSELVTIEWEETSISVAIKEMNWEHIRTQKNRLAEDPIKEVAAMQYLSKWLSKEQQDHQTLQLMQQLSVAAAAGGNINMNTKLVGINMQSTPNIPIVNSNGQYISQQQQAQAAVAAAGMPLPQSQTEQNLAAIAIHQTPQNMIESHIMMPMDLLSDNRNLYSIMPYCAGGELFEVLERKNRFSEPEARYWMHQILKGLSCLKKAGVSHRDLSLENLLVHEGNVLVIDMGMCLRIPMVEHNNINQRFLILPQGVCGKWHYMSPEVCKNQLPFDGPAVDLWAAGVILFLMLTGFPPWERPMLTDERFRYMSNGYLVQMLTEWKVGLSADAMDLLQRMFWMDPTDRLCLEQVIAHPWMNQR